MHVPLPCAAPVHSCRYIHTISWASNSRFSQLLCAETKLFAKATTCIMYKPVKQGQSPLDFDNCDLLGLNPLDLDLCFVLLHCHHAKCCKNAKCYKLQHFTLNVESYKNEISTQNVVNL